MVVLAAPREGQDFRYVHMFLGDIVNIKCPKCGYKRTKQDDEQYLITDCPSCGVIYAKAEAALMKQTAVKLQQKEAELKRREKELNNLEKSLEPESPQPLQDPNKKSQIIGPFTRYFVFITFGLPGFLFMVGGFLDDKSDNLIGIIVGGFIFIFLLFKLPPIQNAIDKSKQNNQADVRKFKFFTFQGNASDIVAVCIIGLVGLFCFSFLKTCFFPIPVDIENGIAKREVIVSPLYTVGVVADTINSHTCDIIKDNPIIKGVEISVWMDGESVSDKYGKKMSGNLYMGSVEENDIEEVKKYKSCVDYSYAMKSKTMARVLAMRHARLLRK